MVQKHSSFQVIKKAFDSILWKEKGIYTVNVNVSTNGNTTYSMKVNKTQGGRPIIPMRYMIVILGFLSFAILNAQRVNIVMALVVMTNSTAPSKTAPTGSECSSPIETNSTDTSASTRTFNWNSEMEGYIISSSFVGFVLTQIMGGRLSEHLGAKQMLSFSIFCASLCNLISPLAATWNIYLLMMTQFVKGMAQGVILPAVSCLMAKWYPKTQLTFLSSLTFSGFPAGALIGGMGSGALCDSQFLGGWPSVFYVFGAMGIVLALLLPLLIHNSPEEFNSIDEKGNPKQVNEKEGSLKVEKLKTPWCRLISSVPTWALLSGIFGQYWMTLYFISVHPTYLANVLNLNMTDSGVFSSLPYILQVFVTWLSSYIAEWFVRKEYATTDTVRKSCNTLSCLIFSASMIGVAAAGCSITLNTVCSLIAMSSIGMGFPGSLTVPMDMTKQLAGTLMGLSSTVGSVSGFILPVIVGYLSHEQQTLNQWNKIMYISAAVVTFSAFIFHLFGSAKLQNWELPKNEKVTVEKALP